MRALFVDGGLSYQADRPVPEPAPGEARERVRRAGICATDLAITRGYMGFSGVPGHEFVGEVEAGPPDWLGRRVVGEINAACGRCPTCERGLARHCPTRTVPGILGRDGAFAEFLTLPVGNLLPVPDDLADDVAVFVEPLAAAYRIREQVQPQPEDTVVVMGDGRLGLLIAQVLAATGCRLTLVGRHPEKRALAKGWGIETADTAETLPRADLETGTVHVAPLIAATYPLADGVEAFAHAARPGVLKVLLAP